MVSLLPISYANGIDKDTYHAVNSNRLEYGSRATITSYQPSMNNTTAHRDYMVYVVQPSSQHTIGAGIEWFYWTSNNIRGFLTVYIHDPSTTSWQGIHYIYINKIYSDSVTISSTVCKASTSTSSTCNPTATGSCWIGTVVNTNDGHGFSAGRCYGSKNNINFNSGIPGATSRSVPASSYSTNPANTLKNVFDNLQFLWYADSNNQGWDYFDVNKSNVWISEAKCLSNSNSNPSQWNIDYLPTTRKFGTGPPTYTTDECTIDVGVWAAGGE
jgi:hypothetical protein